MAKVIKVRTQNQPKSIPQTNILRGKKGYMESSFSRKSMFAWGRVEARHSQDMTVDVLIDSGIKLKRVSVATYEWIGSDTTNGAYGKRSLPPVDSLVLIVFPYGVIEEGLVLCSGYSKYDKVHGKDQASELLVTGKESEDLTIKEGGLKETYNKSSGDYKLELASGAKYDIIVNGTTIEVDASGNTKIDSAGNSEVTVASSKTNKLIANGATIEIDTTGNVKVTPASGKQIIFNSGTKGVNCFTSCLFTGAPHCNDTGAGGNPSVLVPGLSTP